MGDRGMPNNIQGNKQEVEDHRRNFKFSNNKTSVTACNDSLNAKTSNVNFVCVTCGKCMLNDNHDLCVLHYINGVNSRTRQPIVVPISTRGPKHNLVEIILFIVDSGCSKHMMGNLKLLSNFVEKFMGTVKFRNDQIAPILGYGDLVQGNWLQRLEPEVLVVKWTSLDQNGVTRERSRGLVSLEDGGASRQSSEYTVSSRDLEWEGEQTVVCIVAGVSWGRAEGVICGIVGERQRHCGGCKRDGGGRVRGKVDKGDVGRCVGLSDRSRWMFWGNRRISWDWWGSGIEVGASLILRRVVIEPMLLQIHLVEYKGVPPPLVVLYPLEGTRDIRMILCDEELELCLMQVSLNFSPGKRDVKEAALKSQGWFFAEIFNSLTLTPRGQPSSTPISKSADDIMAFRKELDALALKHLGPVPATAPTITNHVNTISDNLNTSFEEVTTGNIKAISPSANHEEEAPYDDDGIITDFNNLPDEVDVSINHTLRIHNAHPQSQILGDPNTLVQTRSSLKKITEAHARVSYIQAQQRSNHKDQQHCLFACFLSQSEPRKVSEALEDES
ncbi:hypothetical protein Tco_0847840 [Tanacetum coccineum]